MAPGPQGSGRSASPAAAAVVSETATGYLSEAYARSLDHLGDVVPLPASGGWVLATDVPGHDERDGRGPYPLFLCCLL